MATLYIDSNYAGVKSDGTPRYPFNTIQEAVDIAQNGESLIIIAGLYRENIKVAGKSLNFKGMDMGNARIEAPAPGPAITFSDAPDNICSRLMITHMSDMGSGIELRHSGIYLEKCVLENNQYGVSTEDKHNRVYIENSIFRKNDTALNLNNSFGTIRKNIFLDQRSSAIIVRDSDPVHIRNNLFVKNNGFAVELRDSTANILSNTVAYNQSGVRIDLFRGGAVKLLGNIIASQNSYGVQVSVANTSSVTIKHNDFYGNAKAISGFKPGKQNVARDPGFQQPLNRTFSGYALSPDSSCMFYSYRRTDGKKTQNALGFEGDADSWSYAK